VTYMCYRCHQPTTFPSGSGLCAHCLERHALAVESAPAPVMPRLRGRRFATLRRRGGPTVAQLCADLASAWGST